MGGTTKETQEIKLPPWLEDASRGIIDKATKLYDTPYEEYGGERVAPISGTTRGAIDMLKSWTGGPNDADRLMGKAEGSYDAISTPGGLDAYINPYVDATLTPAIRNINEASTAARQRAGANAQFAGGRNDARHGIAESLIDRNEQTAIGDVTGRTYSDAFTQAIASALGQGDRYAGLGGETEDQFMGRVNQLEGAGAIEQQNDQSRRDAEFDAYLRKQQDPFDKLAALVGSVSGTPTGRTTEITKPDNTWARIIGSLFGGLFSFAH